jgi:anti-sigma B factor antagonist
MELELRCIGETNIIDIIGMLDLYSSNQLMEFFQKMVSKNVNEFIISLGRVDYIDSSGIGALISIYSTTQQNNLKFCIINMSEASQKVIGLTRLTDFFPSATNLDAAILLFATKTV